MWERIARYLDRNCGTYVDYDDEFFICPECGEPIYRTDWVDSDYLYNGSGNVVCPVCEDILVEAGEL